MSGSLGWPWMNESEKVSGKIGEVGSDLAQKITASKSRQLIKLNFIWFIYYKQILQKIEKLRLNIKLANTFSKINLFGNNFYSFFSGIYDFSGVIEQFQVILNEIIIANLIDWLPKQKYSNNNEPWKMGWEK